MYWAHIYRIPGHKSIPGDDIADKIVKSVDVLLDENFGSY